MGYPQSFTRHTLALAAGIRAGETSGIAHILTFDKRFRPSLRVMPRHRFLRLSTKRMPDRVAGVDKPQASPLAAAVPPAFRPACLPSGRLTLIEVPVRHDWGLLSHDKLLTLAIWAPISRRLFNPQKHTRAYRTSFQHRRWRGVGRIPLGDVCQAFSRDRFGHAWKMPRHALAGGERERQPAPPARNWQDSDPAAEAGPPGVLLMRVDCARPNRLAGREPALARPSGWRRCGTIRSIESYKLAQPPLAVR